MIGGSPHADSRPVKVPAAHPLTCCDAFSAPSGAPRANAFAERWVRTVRHELLDRTLIWNQHQLRRLLEEFMMHHNTHRPHRSLNQRAPTDQVDAAVLELDHQIRRTTTCHGLINEYRVAA